MTQLAETIAMLEQIRPSLKIAFLKSLIRHGLL